MNHTVRRRETAFSLVLREKAWEPYETAPHELSIRRNRGFERFIHTVHRRDKTGFVRFSLRDFLRAVAKTGQRGIASNRTVGFLIFENRTEPHRWIFYFQNLNEPHRRIYHRTEPHRRITISENRTEPHRKISAFLKPRRTGP